MGHWYGLPCTALVGTHPHQPLRKNVEVLTVIVSKYPNLIFQVTAFDPDQGQNSRLEYSIRDSTGPSNRRLRTGLPFAMEKDSGWIKTSKTLDREVAGSYRYTHYQSSPLSSETHSWSLPVKRPKFCPALVKF